MSDSDAPPPRGILCPRCACPRVPVIRTQRIPDAIRRRHECFHCGARFWSRAKVEREGFDDSPFQRHI